MEIGEDIADAVEVAVDQRDAVQIRGQTLLRGVDGRLVAVNADEASTLRQAADDLQ